MLIELMQESYFMISTLSLCTVEGRKMHRFSPQIVVIFCVLSWTCSASDNSLVVDTITGLVRGRFQNVIHRLSVKQFLGIPYAQPPVGQLRFARPQPAKPWNGVRDTVKFGPACPQPNLKEMFAHMKSNASFEEEPQDEDCLTLNVYTPPKATSQDKLAVMVWIHGGGYTFGSGSTYNPSQLVAYHDVIVVTINYRLGVLGFFNIPGTDVKGNYGMHDQVLSLKWVQQNIANFGGDSKNVTIFGESAGGMSVSHHLLSPLSKGLFQRVIAQSGSSASPFTASRVKSDVLVKTFAKALECDVNKELMECLRKKSWLDVFNAQRNVTFPANMREQLLTTVVVDGEFVPDEPRKLLNDGKINQADVMMGVTADEGSFILLMAPDQYKNGANLTDVENMVKYGFRLHPNQNKVIEDAVLFEYTDQSDLDNRIKHRRRLIDLGSDNMFFAPAVFEAKALSKADVPVYFYVFDHHSHFSTLPEYLGSVHSMDLYFSFGIAVNLDGFSDFFKMFGTKFSDLEVGLAHYTMRLWTTFAKHGDPNVGETTPVVTWPRYSSSEHVHLRISLNPKVEYSFRERKMAFWNEFIPKLVGDETEQERGDKKTKEDQSAKEEL